MGTQGSPGTSPIVLIILLVMVLGCFLFGGCAFISYCCCYMISIILCCGKKKAKNTSNSPRGLNKKQAKEVYDAMFERAQEIEREAAADADDGDDAAAVKLL